VDKVSIRRACAADAEQVAAVHAASWRSAYRGIYPDPFLADQVERDRRDFWRRDFARMDERQTALFVAESGGQTVGFVCLRLDGDRDGPLLDNLHVLPACKGLGIGRQLLAAAAGWLERQRPGAPLHLHVWAANRAARGFYRALAGVEVGQFEEEVPGGGPAPIVRVRWADVRPLLANGS
jgi:ribosomal protein S18 acetylase RimI-like enzyme